MFYTGIGSKDITNEQGTLFCKFGFCMVFAGRVLKSGGAPGSDHAFEVGVRLAIDALNDSKGHHERTRYGEAMKIFLPWDSFNFKHISTADGYYCEQLPWQDEITLRLHPFAANRGLSPKVTKLMNRNALQVLDRDMQQETDFIICSTPDAVKDGSKTSSRTGGTGQALRIANWINPSIPIYNIQLTEDLLFVSRWVDGYILKIKENHNIDFDCCLNRYLKGSEASPSDSMVKIFSINCEQSFLTGDPLEVKSTSSLIQNMKDGEYLSINKQGRNGINHVIGRFTEPGATKIDHIQLQAVISKATKEYKTRNIELILSERERANNCNITLRHLLNNVSSFSAITTENLVNKKTAKYAYKKLDF